MSVYDDQRGYYLGMIWFINPFFVVMLIFWALISSDIPGGIVLVSLFSIVLLVEVISVVIRFPRWRRVNRRRQAAANGGQTLVSLAAAQLVPDEQALIVPFTLRFKMNWPPYLGVGALFVFMSLFYSFFAYNGDWLYQFESGGWIFSLIILLVALGGSFFKRPKLQVAPKGLIIGPATIRWNEAKLLAIRGGGKPGDPAREFELSYAQNTLVWKYLRPNRWRSFYKPPMPRDEYEQQMTRVLEYIAAKTNLPLYDVR